MNDIYNSNNMENLNERLFTGLSPVKENLQANLDDYFSKSETLDVDERIRALMTIGFELDLNYEDKILPIFSKVSRELALCFVSIFENFGNLENTYRDYVKQYKADPTKIPYVLIEALKYATNRLKVGEIKEEGLAVLNVTFFKEAHRAVDNGPETPQGEHAPVEKLKDIMFLIANSNISADIIFTDDSIAEKKDVEGEQNTTYLYKKELLTYIAQNLEKFSNIQFLINSSVETLKVEELLQNPELFNSLTEIILDDGKVRIIFTSIEKEVQIREQKGENTLRARIENRNSETNKLTERKGGGVVISFERDIDSYRSDYPANRVVRILSDADRAFPEASFVGDALYSILQENNIAYLADLKDAASVSVGSSNTETVDQQTILKIKRRKLFLSGFLIPTFFQELRAVHNYTGTTQLPAKAVSGEVDYKAAQLKTVQPNVDLGIISVMLHTADQLDRKIDSGPILNRENVGSSTMTSSNISDEWEKTYGPIFKSVPDLVNHRDLLEKYNWIIEFLKRMNYSHYELLFTSSTDDRVNRMFDIIEAAGKNGFKEQDYSELKGILENL